MSFLSPFVPAVEWLGPSPLALPTDSPMHTVNSIGSNDYITTLLSINVPWTNLFCAILSVMNKELLSILFLASSAIAKGDDWDAPKLLKTYFSFQLIWAALSLVQFVWILKNLRKIPSMAARGPYILLTIVTFLLFLYFLLAGIWTRIGEDFKFITTVQYSNGIQVCYAVAIAFQPGVVLWLVHQRGALLRASKGNTISPFTSQLWKQIIDWVLVGITFIIYIGSIANRGAYYNVLFYGDVETTRNFVHANNGLGHTLVALSIVLAINVAASAIALFVQGKRTQWNDLVTARVCYVVVPFFLIYALNKLVFDIYYTNIIASGIIDEETILGADLADIIINGICWLTITTALIVTMSLPGVQWTPARGVPLYPGSHELWSNSKHEESQAFSTPQQQPASLDPQQSYPSQQQPYYLQQ